MSLFQELKRRNVFRVGIAYVVAAWIILQGVDVIGEIIELPAVAGKLILIILAIAFIPAVIFAWAFELTPEGLKREHEVDRNRSIAHQTGRKLNNTILILMALAIAYLLYDKFSAEMGSEPFSAASTPAISDTEPDKGSDPILRQSIAVLPFDSRSSREEDEFFVEGIHDDLLTTIAKIGSMKVISRTSVLEYKDTTKKIPEIAAELGVAHVLEGGIQRSGNQVRINVQLIDAQTDEHLWAEIYDRELTAENLFAIQSEISTAIATALETTLTPEEVQRINTMPTDDLEAYNAYLRGKQLQATRRVEQLGQSIEEFRSAVTLDPEFALAWVGLADSLMLHAQYGTTPSTDTIAEREAAIQTALSIDPNLGEAFASLSQVHEFFQRYDEAEAAAQKAIELSPNYARGYQWYANYLIQRPLRAAENIAMARKAAELDPRSSIIATNLADVYSNQGLNELAERQYRKVIELDPDFAAGYRSLAAHYAFGEGRIDKALALNLEATQRDPGSPVYLAFRAVMFAFLGEMELAQDLREELAEQVGGDWRLAWVDMVNNLAQSNGPGFRETANWLFGQKANVPPFLLSYAASFELADGDAAHAREYFLAATPGWLEPGNWEQLINSDVTNACLVAWVLGQTGDEALGAELLQRTIAFHEQLASVHEHADSWKPDLCYLAAGQAEKALASIETQIKHNHLVFWDIYDRMPLYDLIRHEPGYQAANRERARRIAEQREVALNLMENEI